MFRKLLYRRGYSKEVAGFPALLETYSTSMTLREARDIHNY